MSDFVHLHVHSHYSLLDGGISIDALVESAKASGMKCLALTDHGNLFGAAEFYSAATEAGIKPILGLEAYISPTHRTDRSMGNINTAAYHLLLLAMNQKGWSNLIKLASRAYIEGFYYRPRVDRQLLAEFNEGLICTTACLGGEVPSALLSGQANQARRIAGEYLDIFGRDRFFIELQNQRLPEQDRLNPLLAELAGELGVDVVGTNDVHFLRRQDKPAHEVLTCISTGKTLAESKLEYSPELYLKSPREMCEALSAWPEAVANTLRIAEACDLKIDFTARHLPVFRPPDGLGADEYLRKVAWEGLESRCHGRVSDEYRQRLARELEVIEAKRYGSYVLIVHDFVRHARENGIPCGARGSGCATLLGYCLGISEVDPVRYGLLFERFTDPQRDEAPDFDIDICQEGREKVLQYVRQEYGHVAQIITYGTLKARAALRDVGRVMNIPLAEVDAICKKVPDALGTTLAGALAGEAELKRRYDSEPQVRQLFDIAMSLEGLARHAGVHAAGVVIADEPLENLVPLYRQADSQEVITQWDGPTCDRVGLMKMDFLGLRTLTTINRARELVRQRTGRDIDPEAIPLDDQAVFELFCAGQTDGVFQFESAGMKGVLTQMRPSRIEDLIAANAMYRPGPMELIPAYCSRKHGTEAVPSIHPLVDDILAETYGIMIYQEQVMQVLNRLGKLPLNRALTLIKAISKKKEKTIAEERPTFVKGALENGIAAEEADRLFELILRFAGYGFNKAHSTRYAIVAYQTAYFKVHWPLEFVAALLTFESGDSDKLSQYIAEAERMGIKVAPPEINACGADFAVDGQRVRFGLSAVKGVGAKAVEAIVQARAKEGPFRHLYHFCQHVDLRATNRPAVEALVKCGAFDSLGAHRAAMVAALDHAMQLGQAAAEDRRSGQLNFFDALKPSDGEQDQPRFPDVPPWSESQLLAAEKETLGFYITSHPLVRYGRELGSLSVPAGVGVGRLSQYGGQTPLTVGCMIASVRERMTKAGRSAGKKLAILTVEDTTGKCEAVVFAEAYEKLAEVLQPQKMVFLTGTVDRRRDPPSIVVDQAIPIDNAIESLTGSITLCLPAGAAHGEMLQRLKDVVVRNRGNCPVFIEVRPTCRGDVLATIRSEGKCSLRPSRGLADELTGLLGQENFRLRPKSANGGGIGSRGGSNGGGR